MTRRELDVLDVSPAACCTPLADVGMSEEDALVTAGVLKALADPGRVRIVNLLATAGGPVCVCDLTPQLDLSQPTVSFHLKKLLNAGLIHREQRGIWAYYSIDRDVIDRLATVFRMKEVTA